MAKPVKKFRVGNVSISIWNNNGLWSAEPQRSYKDKDGTWKYSNQFQAQDFCVLQFMLPKAIDWIAAQEEKKNSMSSPNGPRLTTKSVANAEYSDYDDVPF